MKFFLKSEASEERYKICQNCDQLTSLKVCRQCGCFMPFKTTLPWVDCPKGFWNMSDKIDTNNPFPEPPNPEENKEEIIIVP